MDEEHEVIPGKSTRWKPGQSGNPSGRPKLKLLTDAIRDALQTEGPGGKLWVDIVVEKWLQMIFDGDVAALRELLNRLEGRSPLKIDLDANIHDDGSDMLAILQAFAPDCIQPDGRILLPPSFCGIDKSIEYRKALGTRAAVGVAVGAAVAEAILDDELGDDQGDELLGGIDRIIEDLGFPLDPTGARRS